ncbi:VOC family protein [Kribbella antibiotica]|uniref:VOC family protein n=1 Tax=Kribbella antibiotica TaxID=190195 RepID=A0A4R4YQQ8_9ACTN|nr:VOC family protein [Kribbella antibiotica]TDD46489.1 VOC family protein [Kribbella antibiotica]
MGLTLGAIVLNVPDTTAAATFWSQALGFTSRADNPDFLVPPAGASTRLHLDSTDRTHLDLWVTPDTTVAAEVARLESLGAHLVEDWTYPPDADFTVMQAPDGTVFCLIEP